MDFGRRFLNRFHICTEFYEQISRALGEVSGALRGIGGDSLRWREVRPSAGWFWSLAGESGGELLCRRPPPRFGRWSAAILVVGSFLMNRRGFLGEIRVSA